ncbi:MAG: ABC transporter ATP-binding protein [Myxococcales bacterium]|nr:ABC transporter ATP-binding protein [Myxococcales bacterium]
MADTVLEIEGLKTYFHTDDGTVKAVDDVSLSIQQGQTLGVVGESGSGKSVTSLTVMRLLPDRAAQIAGGSVTFLGRDLLSVSARDMADVRGKQISMIFQEPMTSLNPVYRVGDQVAEAIVRHERVSHAEALRRTVALFEEVGLPEPELAIRKYPHQMSGGQKQRVVIAIALACNPKLLIADEPTTALDVTIQAQILDMLRTLRDDRGMSILFITHDLGVIAEIADHVAVMFRGKLVEYGPIDQIFESPEHPYTKGLLACRPRLDTPYRILPTVDDYLSAWQEDGEIKMEEKELTPERRKELMEGGRPKMPEGEGEPLLTVKDLKVLFPKKRDFFGRVTDWVHAVDGISFDVFPGQTLGLVGESGCGKTTTGRAILRLVEPTEGAVHFRNRVRGASVADGAVADGRELLDVRALDGHQLKRIRRNMQIIFQDPYSSLNPRLTVEQAITEPMRVHKIGDSDSDRRARAASLLEEVGLDPVYLRRYPHEFSGGQRQRICIARTLAVEPEFIICDESVSALDVSVQAQVLNLLKELQLRRELTYIFISHDLSVVKFMSDVMCVMKDGLIVEQGPSDAIYADPQQEYTRTLIDAIPRDDIEHIRARQAERAGASA